MGLSYDPLTLDQKKEPGEQTVGSAVNKSLTNRRFLAGSIHVSSAPVPG